LIDIIDVMALPKRKSSVDETFKAVFEKGVLKPLRPLRLKEKTEVILTLHPERGWRKELERLLRRMKSQTKAIPQSEIEAEITKARAEAKANRRAARRSA
jgi:predicted DNA-binding antitoxin AbrB/MazE fold protein